MNFKQWLLHEESVDISKIMGNGEFQLANILINSEIAGRINFGTSVLMGKKIGHIYDVFINDVPREKNAMKIIYPKIEKILTNQGVEEIHLNTVDDIVGEKVWRPFGFNTTSNGLTKTWVKKIPNFVRIPSKESVLNLMTQLAYRNPNQFHNENMALVKELESMINYVPKRELKRAQFLINKFNKI